MGHVGGEFPPEVFPLFPLGDVQNHHHGAFHLPVPEDGVGHHLAAAAAVAHQLFTAGAGQGAVHSAAEPGAAV